MTFAITVRFIAVWRGLLAVACTFVVVNPAPATTAGGPDSDGETLTGTLSQGGASLPLDLRRTTDMSATARPQDPRPPFPYLEEDVTFHNTKCGVTLAGTLTVPHSGGPFPAVVLITGSGPQNRNEEVYGHRPFLVLADYLTRHGIAVLRYDDRGVGASTGDWKTSTTEDFAYDVLTALEWLKQRDRIDSTMIGLIGHSEGGLVGPMAAVLSDEVAFLVMMAAPGLVGEEIYRHQAERIGRLSGATEENLRNSLKSQDRILTILKSDEPDSVVKEKLWTLFQEQYQEQSEEEKAKIGDPSESFKAQSAQIVNTWIRFFVRYDPAPTLMKVKCPVLVLNGDKDAQVNSSENLDAIEKALKQGGNNQYVIRSLPGLNHMFQEAPTGAPQEYSRIEETIHGSVLEIIGDWILQTTKRR